MSKRTKRQIFEDRQEQGVKQSPFIEIKDLHKILECQNKEYDRRIKEKRENFQKDIQILREKSKKFNEPIPSELVIYIYQGFAGSTIFEKYKKWLTDEEEKL